MHALRHDYVGGKRFVCSKNQEGIERLKKQEPTWERVRGWEGMKQAFGGEISLRWLNPFADLICKNTPPSGTATVAPSEMVAQEAFERFSDQEVVIQVC
ncbi:hypothetical protein lerEdw1_012798 [Lerista edwardsae]|nr:hypothetical protein lerEdw1_012798 [Lerista edwardsae]